MLGHLVNDNPVLISVFSNCVPPLEVLLILAVVIKTLQGHSLPLNTITSGVEFQHIHFGKTYINEIADESLIFYFFVI